MELQRLVKTSQEVARTNKRLEKIRVLADFLKQVSPEEIPIAVSYLSGSLRQGRIGIGYAAIRDAGAGPAQSAQSLTLAETDSIFERIAALSGEGSALARAQRIGELLSRAQPEEKDFLTRLIVGELRQGSLEGIMIEALARAAAVAPETMHTAAMISGDLLLAGRVAMEKGAAGLEQFQIRILRPFQPMLAQSAVDIAGAMRSLGRAALEYKMDGIRIQAHRSGGDIRIFTRNLNDVTAAVPDLVEILLGFQATDFVLDGEAVALTNTGKPHPFQLTMRRFGRKLNVDAMRREFPLTPFFFDCLYLNGESLLKRSEDERFSALAKTVQQQYLMPRRICSEARLADQILAEARAAGHEGIMAKDPGSPYEPGVRSSHWLKIKPVHTLDLVVLAAEWGHGRRRGKLSNLHLGALDPETGSFVMLGKTFKGLTDAMLDWQTKHLLAIEISRDRWTVYVRPELVVEVAFNEVQSSPHYPAGLALRFARVKRYRTDKTPVQADTLAAVRQLK